jgi:hypothetical protein
VLAQGPVGGHRHFPQQGSRLALGQGHQPAVIGAGGGRHRQVAQAVDGRQGQGQLQRAGGQALLAQCGATGQQLLQQLQVLLQQFEGGGQGAALGLARCQCLQGLPIHHRHGADLAAAEAVVLHAAGVVELQGDGHRRLDFSRREGRCLAEGAAQQGQPLASHAEGVPLVAQPLIQGAAQQQPFRHRRGMQPQGGGAGVVDLQGHGRQRRGVLAPPRLEQQAGLAGEIQAILGLHRLQAAAGGRRALVQPVFGEQQIQICRLSTLHGQAAVDMALGRELTHRVAIHHHIHHRRLFGVDIGGIAGRQLHAGEQTVVEGGGHHPAVLLLLHLGQQGGGLPLEDALHHPLRRAAAAPIPGHLHQHTVTVPGVVELVVTDVDVVAAVVPQGEAESLAGAAQPGRDQLGLFGALQAGLAPVEQSKPFQGLHCHAQVLFVGFQAEPQSFFEFAEGQGFVAGELVEQRGDRELHRASALGWGCQLVEPRGSLTGGGLSGPRPGLGAMPTVR